MMITSVVVWCIIMLRVEPIRSAVLAVIAQPLSTESGRQSRTRVMFEIGVGNGLLYRASHYHPFEQTHFIPQIKRSITDEIRQEIVSDLLAAVLPRRSPAATQEHTL